MTPGGLVPDFARFAIPRACLCSLPGTGPLPYRLCCLLLSVHVIASGLSSSRSLLRCHLLKDAFPSCSIKNNAYTHTHTHTHTHQHSLFPVPFFIFLLSSYSYLYHIQLFVRTSLESRDFVLLTAMSSRSRTVLNPK